jgi:hypothetical protein
MWSIGRARAVCQRWIDSGKSLPQVRKDSITAGCLSTSSENWPKSAGSPVSERPNQTFLPRGSSRPAPAGAAKASSNVARATAQAATRTICPRFMRDLF